MGVEFYFFSPYTKDTDRRCLIRSAMDRYLGRKGNCKMRSFKCADCAYKLCSTDTKYKVTPVQTKRNNRKYTTQQNTLQFTFASHYVHCLENALK
jgi:hypothetical protein